MHNGNIMGIWYNGKQMRQQNSWVSLKMVELRPIYGQFNGKMMMNHPIWGVSCFQTSVLDILYADQRIGCIFLLRLWMIVISHGDSSLFDGTIYMFSLSHRENWPGLKHTSLKKKYHRTTMVFTMDSSDLTEMVTARPGLSSCSACSWKLWKREIMINH